MYEMQQRYLNEEYPCHECKHEGSVICQYCGTVVTPSGVIHKPSRFESRYGRKKYDNVSVPKSLRRVVIAIIADTERRQRVINLKANKEDVCSMYELLNRAVDKAFQGIEANLRSMLMDDFCNGSGYDRSLSSAVISQRAYYRRKRKIIADVAVLLCLI